jgi:peptide/nickel transport system substrate-binding protein
MKRHLKIIIALSILILFSFVFMLLGKRKTLPVTSGHVLTMGLETKILSFDPRVIGMDANSQYLEELLFLPLVSFDKSGNIENILAESILPESNKSWIIKLKKGVVFASGQEITAKDVVETYNAILHPAFGFPVSPRKGAFKNVTQFEAISPYEVRLELSEPDASFLNNLFIGILPAETAKKSLPNDVMGHNFESGPYQLQSVSETEFVLIKNKKFQLSSPSKMDVIHFKIIPDAGTRYAALLKGDIDLLQNSLDPDKISTLEVNPDFRVLRATKLGTTYLGFNFKNNLMKNLKIRQAISHALDIQSILTFRLHSKELPASSLFPENNFYYNPSIKQPEYNPEKSKQLIKETGLKTPISISVKVSSSNKIILEGAKAIVGNLKAAGFHPQLESLENSIFQDQIRRGISQIWISPWTGFKDPDHLRFIFDSQMIPPNGANRGFYSNIELDKLLQLGREELDTQRRKKIYNQAQALVSQELPYLFLWHGDNVIVMSKSVTGFELYADGRYRSLVNVFKK